MTRFKIDHAEKAASRTGKGRTSLILVLLVIAGSFFTLITTVPVGVRAATLYVGGVGPSNYTTIQLAVDAAIPGDSVFVFNGTYHEQVVIAKPLTLIGESSNVTVIDGDALGDVIYVSSNWVNITGFTVKNSSSALHSAGIELHSVNSCKIWDNNVSSNNQLGIYLNHSSNNLIENNDADDNMGVSGAGIFLSYSDNNTVRNNTASGNAYGLYVEYSTNNSLFFGNASSNWNYGIFMVHSWNNSIVGNSLYDNWGRGILLSHAEGEVIANNSMILNYIGMELELSGNCSVTNNTIVDSADSGLVLNSAFNSVVYNNTVTKNARSGILSRFSYDNLIWNNSLNLNFYASIEIQSSLRENLTSNTMGNGGIYIKPEPLDSVANWATHSIDQTNIVNGKPVRYWKDIVGGTVPPASGQVILANCTGVTIEGQDINGVVSGIALGFSPANVIRSSNSSGNLNGLELFRSADNMIANITASFGDRGLFIWYSDNITIQDFVANHNIDQGVYLYLSSRSHLSNLTAMNNQNSGLSLYLSDQVTVANSTMSGSWAGIGMDSCDNNTILNNIILENSVGMAFASTSRTRIFHNGFVNNTLGAQDIGGNDWWNDSYPSGGNYWSDYLGVDAMHGPGQNLPGADGIGDTPRAIAGGPNQDNYPLMKPYPPLPRAPPTTPLNLQAVAGNAQVTLSWNPPNWDGLATVTNYSIYRGTIPGLESYLVTIGNVTTHLDIGLTNGVTYYYKVAAINIEGEGPKSNEASARPATLPSPPQSLTATPSDRRVDLTWSPPASNGGSPIINYAIYRGITPGGEVHLVTVGNVLSHSDTGLTNGATYYYMVAAINDVGNGPNSTEVSATPLAVPSEPNNLQGTSGNQQITLTWSAPVSDGGTPITNYSIYRGIVPGGAIFFVEIGNVLTYTDAGLTNGQAYYYQVAAKNSLGEGLKTPEIAMTPGVKPGPPVGLGAAPGNRRITLTWSPPIDNGGLPVTAYSIYRGNLPGGETFLITVGNVLTYADTGLNNGQTYYYKVSAWNAMGEGPMSGEASATPSVRPSEPADLAAIAGIGQITVMWLPPIDDGGSTIIGYNVYRGTSPGNEALFVSLGNVLTYLDGGLPNGVTYYYMVSAVNVIGEGPRSIEKSATTPKEPSEPRSLQAASGDGQIRLGWTAPVSDGGMAVRNYEIYRSTASGMEVFLIEVGNVLSHVDTGLVNGQTYYYQVSAKNDVAEGQRSTEVSASPISPATVPAAPQNLQAVAANRRVTLTWLAPSSDGGATIIGYRIFAGTSSSSKALVAQIGNMLTYADTALTNGVTCYYEVAAVNGVGEGARSNEASGTPRSVPGRPLGFTAAAGNGNVALSWNAPADDGGAAITGYKVYRGTQSGGLVLHATLGDVLSYLDPGLTNSRVYYYKVTAINAVGEGPDSGTISATPWNRAPTCIIDDPLYLASVSGTVTVAGTASDQDGTVVRVEISIDGGSWVTVDGTTSWTYSWDTKGVSDGKRTINARSFDGDSYSNLAKVTVNVANEAPKGQDSSLVFALVIVTVLVLVAFYFLWFRRRNVKEEKPPRK